VRPFYLRHCESVNSQPATSAPFLGTMALFEQLSVWRFVGISQCLLGDPVRYDGGPERAYSV